MRRTPSHDSTLRVVSLLVLIALGVPVACGESHGEPAPGGSGGSREGSLMHGDGNSFGDGSGARDGAQFHGDGGSFPLPHGDGLSFFDAGFGGAPQMADGSMQCASDCDAGREDEDAGH